MPLPFIKFYPADWEADLQLMSCSLAAQGLWLRMIRRMHEAEPYGFFTTRAGAPIAIKDFSRSLCLPYREVKALIDELGANQVFSVDRAGRIYSRRMLRDKAKRAQMSENSSQQSELFDRQIAQQIVEQNLEQSAQQNVEQIVEQSLVRGRQPAIVRPRQTQSLRGLDTDSLRSSALEFGEWPTTVGELMTLAGIFVGAFANCRDEAKIAKYLPPYTQVLAQMRSRGISIDSAWQACSDALEANGGKPLFNAAIKTAMSFLPSSRPAIAAPRVKAADAASIYGRFDPEPEA